MPTVSKEIAVTPRVKIGGAGPLFLIAGPCVIESERHALYLAGELARLGRELGIPLIFKASFDKANRSSGASFRGPGFEKGLDIFKKIKELTGLPVLSDIHETRQVEKAARVLDVLQIPALLCRQTDLILEAAGTGKPLNIKKGQFLSPHDMKNVLDKALSRGNENIMLTERGAMFGYNNLVFDVRSIPVMKAWGYPVIVDASHSVQRPGGEGSASGGDSDFIPHIARAGVAAGADGIFLEVHEKPESALSDRHNSFAVGKLEHLWTGLVKIHETVAASGD